MDDSNKNNDIGSIDGYDGSDDEEHEYGDIYNNKINDISDVKEMISYSNDEDDAGNFGTTPGIGDEQDIWHDTEEIIKPDNEKEGNITMIQKQLGEDVDNLIQNIDTQEYLKEPTPNKKELTEKEQEDEATIQYEKDLALQQKNVQREIKLKEAIEQRNKEIKEEALKKQEEEEKKKISPVKAVKIKKPKATEEEHIPLVTYDTFVENAMIDEKLKVVELLDMIKEEEKRTGVKIKPTRSVKQEYIRVLNEYKKILTKK
jgi:hypothetical protein